MEVASTSEEIDVWENLKQIFADMDAQDGNDENKQLLKEPLTRLRRLLHIHQDVLEKEKALKRCHLGVLVERDWYLRKLRDVEVSKVIISGESECLPNPFQLNHTHHNVDVLGKPGFGGSPVELDSCLEKLRLGTFVTAL